MDEELGVKAPVTRLRRRLSTEAEGAQSPLTPSTPTKKRGTRIAKPALELIDENVTETVPKKITRRASAKEEPMEEKPATPSRRSSRIRSNTSLLMEAAQNNIVSDSPRAKRALRRNSQIGQTSDTETSTTPARRTRVRKDSTSSVEKLGVTSSNEKIIAPVAETISEEPEKEISKDSKLNVSQNATPVRKSPRLNKKVGLDNTQNDTEYTAPKLTEDASSSPNELTKINKVTSNTSDNTDRKPEPIVLIGHFSPNTTKLINKMTKNSNKLTDVNKTTSAIESNDDKDNRKRTKSWNTTANDSPSEKNINPAGLVSRNSIVEKINVESSAINNISIENKENIQILKPIISNETIKILEKTPTKNIQSVVLMEDSDSNNDSEKLTMDIHNESKAEKNFEGDQCVPVVKQTTPKRSTSESFVVEPMDIDETIPENVTINDFSDRSNSSKEDNQISDSKQNLSKSNENRTKSLITSTNNIEQETNKSKRKSLISSSQENFKDILDRLSTSEKSQRKLSTSIFTDNDNITGESNKSKRNLSLSKADSDNEKRKLSISKDDRKFNESLNKSNRKSVSESETQNPEKSSNENKSTLVLSQLKDVSTNETSKSSNDTNNELSNSVNISNKETDKKNNSKYLTSTPLHQRPLHKLIMQINTSVVSPNIDSKISTKANKSKTPVKKVPNVNQDSDSSDDSDDDSREQSQLVDDEAKEASDFYESGDSRDAEERQYEEDHEITEKGETLESEPSSDDSENDYEKDSFVVSSDEEDNDLLSGSGDDLSLTDNELKITAKSKKKFNERKRKEQKNASREMYEARHRLNRPDKSSESKKSKSKKLESSSSESEEEKESEIQPKKKNRLRIDSSQDVSVNNSDADESVGIKKKKSKQLTKSVCDDDANEKEVTIQNQSMTEKDDPLAMAIKKEPKTPQKHFNLSTVLINDNIEQVEVDTNVSVMKSNETSDPLQATLAHDDEESDSDISENMEIKENYDSVLKNLNKTNEQNKTGNISLNLNKKGKDKAKEPIIDQLNLTQTKKSKKTKVPIDKDHATEKAAHTNENLLLTTDIKNDDNSDSIDVRLLFSEDSNDSEVNANKFTADKSEEPSDKVIPLKRTEAKTNLRESIGEPEDASVNFFIDTKGSYEDIMDVENENISVQNSSKKKNKKHKQNVSSDDFNSKDDAETEELSINVSLKEDKKQKKNKSLNISQRDQEPVMSFLDISSRYEKSNLEAEETANQSINSAKKKKKNKSQLDNTQNEEPTAPEETQLNVSLNSEKKKKKNKSQLDTTQIDELAVPEETSINISVNSQKKKKNKSQDPQIEVTTFEETPVNISMNSDKKKKKNKSLLDNTQNEERTASEEMLNILVNSQKKKKKVKSLDIVQNVEDAAPQNISINVSMNGDKKKKNNKSLEISHENIITAEETVANISRNSDKKQKKISDNAEEIEENAASIETNDASPKRKKKNKKKKSQDVSQTVDNTGNDSDEAPEEVAYKSEKKSDNPEPVENDDTLNKSKNKFKKKKKKNKNRNSQTDQDMNADQGDINAKKRKYDQTADTDIGDGDGQKMSKTNKKKMFGNDEGGISTQGGSNISKKRKATEDDQRNSKVFKSNLFEKAPVPRLPESIVNQLNDQPAFTSPKSKKPKKKKIKTAISTMPFVVEEGIRRKNKPSTYLEQSVYLNDSISPVKKKKKIKNPKVLPFTPTVVTSGTGYTSKFKINVLPEETQFIAQASNIKNFREVYLSKHRAKKLKLERLKKQRNPKLTKF